MPQAAPIPFDASMEKPEDDENQVRQDLIETLRSISQTTFENSGHAIRSVHAKSHALIVADVEVFAGLPPELAQGLFAKPAAIRA